MVAADTLLQWAEHLWLSGVSLGRACSRSSTERITTP